MTESEIFKITYADGMLTMSATLWMVIIAAFFIVALLAIVTKGTWLGGTKFGPFKPKQVRLHVAGMEVTLEPDYSTLRIAHQTWAELVTRKAGQEIDLDHDVIVENYDSWYELFEELRRLLKSIPAEDLKDSNDAQKLVKLILEVMNGLLRQHLTRWQARFRNWYANEIANGRDNPQETQRRYPEYTELFEDLRQVNSNLVDLTSQLGSLVNLGSVSLVD